MSDWVNGFDVDEQRLADYLRVLADGIEDRGVAVHSVNTGTQAESDSPTDARVGLDFSVSGAYNGLLMPQFYHGGDPDDEQDLEAVVRSVVDSNPEAVADYPDDPNGVGRFLVGKAMQRVGGDADPSEVDSLLADELNERTEGDR